MGFLEGKLVVGLRVGATEVIGLPLVGLAVGAVGQNS